MRHVPRPCSALLLGSLAASPAQSGDPMCGSPIVNEQFFQSSVQPDGVFRLGDRLWFRSWLQAVDTSDPMNPSLIGESTRPGSHYLAVPVSDSRIVVTSVREVCLIDVSDEARPVEVSSVTLRRDVNSIAVADGLAVAEISGQGFDVVDLDGMTVRASVLEPVVNLVFAADSAVYAVTDEGVRPLDLTDPAVPFLGAPVALPSTEATWAVAAGDGLVYLSTRDHLIELDVTDPGSPVVLDHGSEGRDLYHMVWDDTLWEGGRILGTRRFPSWWLSGSAGLMLVIDPSGEGAVVESSLGLPSLDPVAVLDGHIYTAGGSTGLLTIDPSRLDRESKVATPYTPLGNSSAWRRMQLLGDRLYAMNDKRIMAYDLDAPAGSPPIWMLQPRFPLYSFAGAAVEGDRLYVSEYLEDFFVYDIGGGTPVLLSQTGGVYRGGLETMVIRDGLVFASGESFFQQTATDFVVVDVRDDLAPRLVAAVPVESRVLDIQLDGDVAYIAGGGAGPGAIDISNPDAPVEIGYAHSFGGANLQLAIDGDDAYAVFIGATSPNVLSYRILAPGLLVLQNAFDWVAGPSIRWGAESIALRDGVAFVGTTASGVHMYDLADPASPAFAGAYLVDRPVQDLEVSGGRVYAMNHSARVYAFDEPGCDCPADLAPPAGVLDLADLVAFVAAFTAGDPAADFAPPESVVDLADVVGFVTAFGAGCP